MSSARWGRFLPSLAWAILVHNNKVFDWELMLIILSGTVHHELHRLAVVNILTHYSSVLDIVRIRLVPATTIVSH